MTLTTFSNKWAKIASHFLVFAAIAGVGLRFYNFSMIEGVNYKFLLHTHSHIALLGWMFLAFAVAMVKEFLPDKTKVFHKIFFLTLISVIGMMLSFPFQGYAAISITFSTLFLLVSYWFVIEFYNGLKKARDNSLSTKWIRWSLFFLVISSFGPWALGPIMVFGESHGVLYNLAIYYYLHFLYNGFFVLVAFGIILKQLDNKGIDYSTKRAQLFFQLTVYGVIPAYALSMLWINPPIWVYLIGGLAGAAQLLAFVIGWPILKVYMANIKSRFYQSVLLLVLVAYAIKVLMQFLSAIPSLAAYAYETRVFTAIGYIHLVMLGFLSLFILIYFVMTKTFLDYLPGRIGVAIFSIGIVLSEVVLFSNGILLSSQGSFIPDYSLWMLLTSSLMPIGLIIFWANQMSNRKRSNISV